MLKRYIYLFLGFLFAVPLSGLAQQPVGIGTQTPDAHAALDIESTTAGVLFPRLTTAQQTTLAGMLGSAETGMVVTDAGTGAQIFWNGTAFQHFTPGTAPTAQAPLSIQSNKVALNPGTAAGDLITWDGTNWVNSQPAVQHFSIQVDNHQPFLAINFCIALFGIFPTQNDASQPYVGEIIMMGSNFPPLGWQTCDGSLISIASNVVLFQLIGTTYGGDGISTYAVPDLRSRAPLHYGSNGTSSYILGQSAGTELKTFAH